MSELAKAYEPAPVEAKRYAQWLERGDYHADPASPKPPYSIVIPPPNVTGMLTMGHVLNNTIQDILARRARLQGHEVLWLPGTDHAGIATQTAVEKSLRKTEGKTRHDFGRDVFLEKVWEWKEKHGGIIIQQLKKLGCSCDWQRERFTMDDHYHKVVQQCFVTLYERGYIYRGKRMVNWCPASLTAISDEEVIPKAQNSVLYHMRYEVAEEPGTFLDIATTRPETLMGDTAVAVHPGDERFQHLIGKHVWRPFPKEQIPIIADDHIDPAFGTGVLKVTPAHDKADFEIGQRHQLPAIDVLHPDGRIHCPTVPELDGIDRFEARKKAAAMLQELGLLIREEPYQNNVGFSERADVPIEPRLSEQWFLRYPKIKEAINIVRDGTIRFFPARWEKVYDHWLENIQDWCISRQLWWGHRIPVWYCGEEIRCQIDSPGAAWQQDPDVLDTWFSSWLWAYETMDEATRKRFYPTSALVTGPDIIFLWVARMIIAGLEFQPGGDQTQDNLAFRHVYFTGLIRDNKGRKMSKSLGNSPDPLDLIAKYGADGLRFGLMRIAPQGQDIRFDEKQIEEGRNFCNKLWNACRFRAMQGPIDPHANPAQVGGQRAEDGEQRSEDRSQKSESEPQSKNENRKSKILSPFSHDLLIKLDTLIESVERGYADYQFSQVAGDIYAFVWDEFCSRFLEVAKADFHNPDSPTRAGTLATIDYVLSRVLRLLHPYAPFITEELWLELGFGSSTIQFADWPAKSTTAWDEQAAARARALYTTMDLGRSLRGEFGIASNQKATFQLKDTHLDPADLSTLTSLLNASSLELVAQAPARTPMLPTPVGELFLPLEGLVDIDKLKERFEKELLKARADRDREEKKLANETMLANAPLEKVDEWKSLHQAALDRIKKLETQLAQL